MYQKIELKWKPENRKDIIKALPKGLICAEVGVWSGLFSMVIAQYGRPKEHFLVDNWLSGTDSATTAYDGTKKCFGALRKTFRRHQRGIVRGTTRIVMGRSPDVSEYFKDNYLDFVYIDADHSYEAVLKDITAWYEKVRPGGVVAGHDYNFLGNEWNRPECKEMGVARAVNEFCASKGIVDVGTTNCKVSSYYFNKPL